jgi:hypothetical protein
MAKVIPTNPIFRTNGERQVVEVLEETLDALWTIYYEPVISGKQPDLVLFHEYQGIIILEVKDYTKSIFQEINPDFWKIRRGNSVISVKSPIKQAIEYRNELITLLSREQELVEENGNYQGKLKIPVVTACVFPNLTMANIKELGIDRIIPKKKLFSKEDIGPNLGKRISELTEQLFISNGLTEKEANIVKNYIYPNMVISEDTGSYVHSNLEEISNFSVDYVSFDHYVDEIHFVMNKINHVIRLEAAKAIGIVFPVNRSLRVGTLEQFIRDSLKSRNLLLPNQSFSVHIADIKRVDYNIKFDYLFVLDINTIRDKEDYQELKRLIKNYMRGKTNIILTSNKKSFLTEKLKNRLAGR